MGRVYILNSITNQITNESDLIKWANTNIPKKVSGINNTSYNYYFNTLFTKIKSLFEFTNIPIEWDIDYFKNVLFSNGYITVVKTPINNILALEGGLYGINIYNKPTDINIQNVVLGSFTQKIGEGGEIIYLNNLGGVSFQNALSIVERYASLLAECDGSLNTTLINSRVAHIFEAQSKAEELSIKKMYDDITAGNPFICIRTDDTRNFKPRERDALNVKNVFIGNDILLTKRTILNEFYSEIGVSNANIDKRERLTTAEVDVKSSEIMCIVNVWLDNLKISIDRVNKLFNLNIKVEYSKHIKGEEVTEWV